MFWKISQHSQKTPVMEHRSVILLKKGFHHSCFFREFSRAPTDYNNTCKILDNFELFLEYLRSTFGPPAIKKNRKF